MPSKLIKRIDSPGPKKILSCDGGGILGLISVEILARIEADLRIRVAKPDLVLADWFDFVCGTSTGAIIAACIATGMSMDRIREFYVGSGEQMFDKASVFKRLSYNYNDEPLAEKLRSELNRALGYAAEESPALLGDNGLRTPSSSVLACSSTGSASCAPTSATTASGPGASSTTRPAASPVIPIVRPGRPRKPTASTGAPVTTCS